MRTRALVSVCVGRVPDERAPSVSVVIIVDGGGGGGKRRGRCGLVFFTGVVGGRGCNVRLLVMIRTCC